MAAKHDRCRIDLMMCFVFSTAAVFPPAVLADPHDCMEKRAGKWMRVSDYSACIKRVDLENERNAKTKTAKQDMKVWRNVGSERSHQMLEGRAPLHFTEKANRSAEAAIKSNGLRRKPTERYAAVIPKTETYREAKVAGGDKDAREILLPKSKAKKWASSEHYRYSK